MKTAISLLDDLFTAAAALADRLGVSRSELCATALAEFVAKHNEGEITARLNQVYAEEPSDLDPAFRRVRRQQRRGNVVGGWTAMDVSRGELWWAELAEPRGSEPGYRRPVLIVQAMDGFNRSRISTVLCTVLTSSLRLVDAPGNVLIPAKSAGLPEDSVANVSHVVTLDRAFLVERIGKLPSRLTKAVDAGLKLVLGLS